MSEIRCIECNKFKDYKLTNNKFGCEYCSGKNPDSPPSRCPEFEAKK